MELFFRLLDSELRDSTRGRERRAGGGLDPLLTELLRDFSALGPGGGSDILVPVLVLE